MRRKKGLTLVETIIAMAVLIIVSFISLSVSNYAISQTNKAEIKMFFQNEAQNYVNCYLLGQDKYDNAIMFYTGKTAVYGEDCEVYYDGLKISNTNEGNYHVKLLFEIDKFVVKCFADTSIKEFYALEV